MPYKALALYPMPDGLQAFRDHYVNIHLPLVAKLPGLRSLSRSYGYIAQFPRGAGSGRSHGSIRDRMHRPFELHPQDFLSS
jgi:uncharacterized protein (TIGR02118 family)